MFLIMVDLVKRRFAAADMVREILDVREAGRSSRNVHARDLNADPVPFLKEVCGSQDFDGVFVDLPGHNGPLRLLGKGMPGLPRF